MKIRFWAPLHFEPWDYRNYVERGIGGSETCVCEMSWRLAQRGEDVVVYSPVGDGCDPDWRGVRWLPLEAADFSEDALWIICRAPRDVERCHPNGRVWVMCQDEDYPGQWTPEVVERTEIVMALSAVHGRHLMRRNPQLEGKVRATSNGVRVELFERLEADGIERNPRRAIYASSPDRGLAQALLPLWPRIRERVPDAELHVYYGFDNIDKMVAANPKAYGWLGKLADRARALMDQPGVFWHGRVGQDELYRAWLSSGVWLYPSDFSETCGTVNFEAQCGGAIPVTRPWWGVGEGVRHGFFVNGRMYSDPLAQAQFVDYAANLMLGEGLQAHVRQIMTPEARARCDWERVVDQWEAWAHGYPWPQARCQFAFQHRHLEGPAVNIGCGCDYSRMHERGVVNVDINAVDPGTGTPNTCDCHADGRALPFSNGAFRTAVLGDILEHCSDSDARVLVREANRVADRLVVTVPEDHRSVMQQQMKNTLNPTATSGLEYAPGVTAWHRDPMTRNRLLSVLGNVPDVLQPIRYDNCGGWGAVVEASR